MNPENMLSERSQTQYAKGCILHLYEITKGGNPQRPEVTSSSQGLGERGTGSNWNTGCLFGVMKMF